METIKDIENEMRNRTDLDGRDMVDNFSLDAEFGERGGFDALKLIHAYADRIKAAREREIADALNTGAFVAVAYDRESTREKSSQVGNVAKIRKTLEKFIAVDLSGFKFPLDGDSSAIYNSDKKEITIPYWRVAELLNEVKAAQDMTKSVLPTPPRNYDLLCWEMHKRHSPNNKGGAK